MPHTVSPRCTQLASVVALVVLMTCYALSSATAAPWLTQAPEQLPRVTVRWEDSGQNDVFVVEGERYQCRVAVHPARIISLSVDGRDVLGPEGLLLSVEDGRGAAYRVPEREFVPVWEVWTGQNPRPARSSAARMNVHSAGPYYWDAHLLDIPLMTAEAIQALTAQAQGPPLATWAFEQGLSGWEALNSSTLSEGPDDALVIQVEGEDPYIQSPAVDILGPVLVNLRIRTTSGGGGALYWYEDDQTGYSGERVSTFPVQADDEWHDYAIPIRCSGRLQRLRLDPPGTDGTVYVGSISISKLQTNETAVAAPPVRGEMVLHAHPDRLHIELKVADVEQAAGPLQAVLHAPGAAGTGATCDGRPALIFQQGPGAVLGMPGAEFAPDTGRYSCPMSGNPARAYWVFRPTPDTFAAEVFAGETSPLPPEVVSVSGGDWAGYDAPSGLYVMRTAARGGAFGFEQAYKNPSRRMTSLVGLRNDAVERRITVKAMSGAGNLEAAVLTDAAGFPLPTPCQVAKNFAGEREEPDDTAFGDAYFPLNLKAGEPCEFQVMHLFQNWGDHMLKQVSSIRFFHIYWHLSTGCSETTCFSHNRMRTGGVSFRIPDFRPLSGEFWSGQPQHSCLQWPGLLQYNGGKEGLVYEDTVFEAISPNLSRFTMRYHSTDDTARASVEVMEIPQRDEMRTFLRLRYDWVKPCEIEGDARVNFRILNMHEKKTQQTMLWTPAEGDMKVEPIAADGSLSPLGALLAPSNSILGTHGGPDAYHSFVLLRSFRARLGGEPLPSPAVSAKFTERNGSYWLSVPQANLSLVPGDFVEADLMLMPHGEYSPVGFKPQRERERYGTAAPTVPSCSIGEKLADFPARVKASDEVAAFAVEGGHDYLPIIVEGFAHWGVPLLWQGGVWQDQQTHGGDGYQVEPDGTGGYRFTFVYPIRRGQKHEFVVTRADCTTGISRLRDANGHVVLQSPTKGRFSLKAPCLFAPGDNTVSAEAPYVEFSGKSETVRSVPLSASVGEGRALVRILSWESGRCEVSTSGGPVELTFGELTPGGRYRVTVDGNPRVLVAQGGAVRIRTPAEETSVSVEPE